MRFVYPTLVLGASLLVVCDTEPSTRPDRPAWSSPASPVVESASGEYHERPVRPRARLRARDQARSIAHFV